MSTPSDDQEWQARAWSAAALRAVIVGVPVVAGWVCSRILARQLGGLSPRWLSVVVILGAAILVSILVSRLTNRLMPLAVLLKMTMIFPDKAPSRLKVARRTTSVADIKGRLDSPRLEEQDAAATMLALVTALGRHDRHTRGHSERVRLFCDLLSEQLRLPAADAGRLRWAALIHDIGKLQIPTAVLNKPGKLDDREWDLIRQHPDAGARLAAPLAEWLGPWFTGIAEHHERYDGTGYPRGLAATAISPAGRAIAVVDAFETMTASRSYKSARTTLAARAELTRCAGTHFDPAMVRAFLGIALPRLLWSVGPLAFLVNAPFLRLVGEGGLRVGNVVGTSTLGAANAASVAAVAVAVGASPTAVAATPPAHHSTVAVHRTTSHHRPADHPSASDAGRAGGGRPSPALTKPRPVTPAAQQVPAPGAAPGHTPPAGGPGPGKKPPPPAPPPQPQGPGAKPPKPPKPPKPSKPSKPTQPVKPTPPPKQPKQPKPAAKHPPKVTHATKKPPGAPKAGTPPQKH